MTSDHEMPKPGSKAEPIDLLDAIYDDADLDEEVDVATVETEEDRAWDARMREQVRGKLAALRRRRVPPDDEPLPATPIRAAIVAMERDALLAGLDFISQRAGGALQMYCRNLSQLSDDDLRRLLETISDPE